MRLLTFLWLLPFLATAAPRTEHVFIFSFDGCNPTILQQAETPTIKRLAAEGAHTWEANTIIPSKTLPSHTSMITGVDISKHGIDWNDYFPMRGMVKVPTIFALTKTAHPEFTTALFCGKIKFRHLWLKGSLDVFNCGSPYTDGPIPASEEKKLVPAPEVAAQAAAYIVEKKPQLCFVHFPDIDSAGHKYGWGSPEQMEAFKVCDAALATVLAAIDQAGLLSTSTLILTGDHGGKDKGHFEPVVNNTTIPWVAWGQGVKKKYNIAKKTLYTYDTAATALWLLDVPRPEHLDGEPVEEAFE